jgi:hypothetical protein
MLGDDRLYRQAGYTGLSRGRERNDVYLVVDDDDGERDTELERHGAVDEDHPVERFVRALNRDGSKLMASDERDTHRVTTAEPFGRLWARRDELVSQLAESAPPDTAAKDDDALEMARAKESQAAIKRSLHEERLAGLGGLRHRSEREDARRDLAQAVEHEDRRRRDRERLEALAAAGVRTERQWLARHHDDVDDLAELEFAIARRTRLAGRAAEVDRPENIVAVLGEPPVDLAGRDRWRSAAGAIESYAARWCNPPEVANDAQDHSLDRAEAAHLEVVRRAVAYSRTDAVEGIDAPEV